MYFNKDMNLWMLVNFNYSSLHLRCEFRPLFWFSIKLNIWISWGLNTLEQSKRPILNIIMYMSLLSCKCNGFRHFANFQVVFLSAPAYFFLWFLHELFQETSTPITTVPTTATTTVPTTTATTTIHRCVEKNIYRCINKNRVENSLHHSWGWIKQDFQIDCVKGYTCKRP